MKSAHEWIQGWGRFPSMQARVISPADTAELSEAVINNTELLAVGAMKAYGDACLANTVLNTTLCNNIIVFDADSGLIEVECGLTFAQLIEIVVPKGWFPYVTPGTSTVTMGGALAADVHGKNHHAEGSFVNYVQWFDLIRANGKTIRCSREQNSELFWASAGGMGQTGVIVRLCLQLKKIHSDAIIQELSVFEDLDALMDSFEVFEKRTYSVAWIDLLNKGRGVLFTGEHAEDKTTFNSPPAPTPKWTFPKFFPGFMLNNWTIQVFNQVYFYWHRRKQGIKSVPLATFFYPLDSIAHWNRGYGKSGFIQYQCVFPESGSKEGLLALIQAIKQQQYYPFLTVLKKMGPGVPEAINSFPRKGFTLAMDFPVTPRIKTLVDAFDQIVLTFGGRVYRAKDALSDARLSPLDESGFEQKFVSRQHLRLRQ